jgi:tetratricopeptide (TPR) repeat protein
VEILRQYPFLASDVAAAIEAGQQLVTSGDLAEALAIYRMAGRKASLREHAVLARFRAEAYRRTCQWHRALRMARASRTLAARAPDRDLQAEALSAEGAIWQVQSELNRAASCYKSASRVAVSDRTRGIVEQNLGTLSALLQRFESALQHYSVSASLFQKADYAKGEAVSWNNHGRVLTDMGRHMEALPFFDKAEALARACTLQDLVALVTMNRAECMMHLGDTVEARRAMIDACRAFETEGDMYRVVGCLKAIGEMYMIERRQDLACSIWERGLDIASGIGATLEAAEIDRLISKLRKTA